MLITQTCFGMFFNTVASDQPKKIVGFDTFKISIRKTFEKVQFLEFFKTFGEF